MPLIHAVVNWLQNSLKSKELIYQWSCFVRVIVLHILLFILQAVFRVLLFILQLEYKGRNIFTEACTSSSGANSASADKDVQEKTAAAISEDERKKRPRTAFTATQIKSLEAEFERNKYLSVAKRLQLSKNLKLTETQVNILFSIIPF